MGRHLYGANSQGRQARRSAVQQSTAVELIVDLKTAKDARRLRAALPARPS
jgi:hypothetical protein